MVEIISDRSGVAASERLDPSGVPNEMESSLGSRFSPSDGRSEDVLLANNYDVKPHRRLQTTTRTSPQQVCVTMLSGALKVVNLEHTPTPSPILSKALYSCLTFTHSYTDGGANHAR